MAPRQWRNRIIGHGEEDAEQLLANPKNWRIHPREQQEALEAVLANVGWVQNVIVNKRTGFVVDGHARVAMAISKQEPVPVVYVDLSEQEESLILATLDPLSAMAGKDDELFADLIAGMDDAYKALVAMTGADLDVGSDGLTDPDAVPPEQEAVVTVRGDVMGPRPAPPTLRRRHADGRYRKGSGWRAGRHGVHRSAVQRRL